MPPKKSAKQSEKIYKNQVNIKRLMKFAEQVDQEMKEARKNGKENERIYDAKPSNEDITVWYIKIKNLEEEYKTGIYYMKLEFTDEYPFKPPNYYMLTPSGRFDVNKKICFSNTNYHADEWSPLWGIDQIIIGMISFFYERDSHGISHLNTSKDEKMMCAKTSVIYNKNNLSDIEKLFNE